MLEKAQWAVIYANIPLWIAIGILAFIFGKWEVVKYLLYVNIAVLLLLMVFSWRRKK